MHHLYQPTNNLYQLEGVDISVRVHNCTQIFFIVDATCLLPETADPALWAWEQAHLQVCLDLEQPQAGEGGRLLSKQVNTARYAVLFFEDDIDNIAEKIKGQNVGSKTTLQTILSSVRISEMF